MKAFFVCGFGTLQGFLLLLKVSLDRFEKVVGLSEKPQFFSQIGFVTVKVAHTY